MQIIATVGNFPVVTGKNHGAGKPAVADYTWKNMYSIRRDIITVFLFLNVKTVMFFLCTAEHYSIINPVLLHKLKGYNKENGKPDESLGRKARRG